MTDELKKIQQFFCRSSKGLCTVDNVLRLVYQGLARPSLEKLPPAVDGNMYPKWDGSTSGQARKDGEQHGNKAF